MVYMDVLKAVGGAALNDLKDKLLGRKYGEATEAVNAIIANQVKLFENMGRTIQKAITQSTMDSQTVKIRTWTQLLADALAKAATGSPDDLTTMIKDLKTPGTGIYFTLSTINDCMTKKVSGSDDPGLIYLYNKQIQDKVSSDDMGQTVSWMFAMLDQYLEGYGNIQLAGLALRIATAESRSLPMMPLSPIPLHRLTNIFLASDEVQKYSDSLLKNLADQRDYAYSLFPTVIRKFKPDYATEMTSPMSKWTRYYVAGGRKALARKTTGWAGRVGTELTAEEMNPEPRSEWKLDHAWERPGTFELVNRLNTSDNKKNYLNAYYMQTSGVGANYYECQANTAPDSSRAKFKIVPNWDSQWPRFRLKAENTSIRNKFPFDTEWEMTDEGVGQDDNDRRA
ncbi:uncharacterized protein KY384_005027 [Bacidia gigantensis]|uniref:uncharacterized protein n=1 Tax=Bacidia gigantensis TaxID=2732470 RepID=UPI001D05AA30|nr:uncharacterized protein KY384_005027 [Bacidia gigantensis]KAG8530524.1 hypothetical protein KY384_005027 [Bacidia gigantensis]